MRWRGRTLTTYGDMIDAVEAIAKRNDRKDAREFMKRYRAESVHADVNVGYLAGYLDEETRELVYEVFGLRHPLFGRGY